MVSKTPVFAKFRCDLAVVGFETEATEKQAGATRGTSIQRSRHSAMAFPRAVSRSRTFDGGVEGLVLDARLPQRWQ